MKSREQRIADQGRILMLYDQVKEDLLRIPGVVEVGVGSKEVDGVATEELAFRVYVNEKLPESSLPSEEVIPKTIGGFPTDVIKKYDPVPLIGFDDEDDWKNYDTKAGGMRIGSEDGGGTGTLGCFCRLKSDNSVVFLSNHHVLFSGSAKVGSGVGQPNHKESCCCTCNEIGQVLDGDQPLDCAIAKLNTDVTFAAKVRRIKKADGTTENPGFIDTEQAAVHMDEVWKVGARTGLTRGKMTQVLPHIIITPDPPFTKIADHGDSGSVVVNFGTNHVVGLLWAINVEGGPLGLAKPIMPVVTRLNITIIPTDQSLEYDVLDVDEDALDLAARLTRDSVFAPLEARLRDSEAGRQILDLVLRHGEECLELVNKARPVTVLWHRQRGPAFLAALARSAKEPSYRFPDSIEGVDRREAAMRICEALVRHGSEALRADFRTYSAPVLEAFAEAETVDEFIRALERTLVGAAQV
jgi:hypothetical protein